MLTHVHDRNVVYPKDGQTALHIAVLAGQLESASWLLRSGANYLLEDEVNRERCVFVVSLMVVRHCQYYQKAVDYAEPVHADVLNGVMKELPRPPQLDSHTESPDIKL
jgi:hypothetical protein